MADLHKLQSTTIDLIYAHHKSRGQQDGERTYLGGSALGDNCDRRLWLQFRWAYFAEPFEGRMIRLFETGHLQEDRMIDDLRAAGCEVIATTEDGEQIAVSFANGHGGGHLDGEVKGIWEAPKAVHVLECKTHNEKSFAQLKKDGVLVAKPQHYAQMQVYMHLRGRDRAAYMAVNKNTEELYLERVNYDAEQANRLMAKADRLVNAHQVPDRIASSEDAWPCRFCDLKNSCHGQALARRNCRTCLHSTPVEGGKWWCSRHDRNLSAADQRQGCPNHLFLPSLVPGKQIDADAERELVTYAMGDGTLWNDGSGRAA